MIVLKVIKMGRGCTRRRKAMTVMTMVRLTAMQVLNDCLPQSAMYHCVVNSADICGIRFKALSHCTANPWEINSREIPGGFSPHQHPSDRLHCNSWGGISRGYAQSFRVINPVQTLVQHKTPGFYPLTLLPSRVEHSPGKSYSPGISFVV